VLRVEVDELFASAAPRCPICGERVDLAVPCGAGREMEPPIYPSRARADQSAEPCDGSAEVDSSPLEAVGPLELESPQLSVPELSTRLERFRIDSDSVKGATPNDNGAIADEPTADDAMSAPNESETTADDARSAAGTQLGDQGSASNSIAPSAKQTSAAEQHAIADAIAFFSSESAAWMHQVGGIKSPSVAEAARLRLISDRLVQHKRERDIEGAVMTYLEIELPPRARPTKQERKKARAKMEAFFASELGM